MKTKELIFVDGEELTKRAAKLLLTKAYSAHKSLEICERCRLGFYWHFKRVN
jgi:hypothetical protein